MSLRILLCDDHVLVREGVAMLLSRQPGWQVVAQVGDGAEAVRRCGELTPDVAVVDVAMPGVSGIEAALGIRACSPGTRIVALSMYGDGHYRRRMLAAGATGYVLKNEAAVELVSAIRTVLSGQTYLSPALRDRDGDPAPARCASLELEKLTPREMEVLRELARGRTAKDAATRLGISAKTVETHRGRLMMKLGIDNLAGLVRFAIRAGVISAE
jgi:DNA-binding NarL/FixJ family response regulator